MSLCLGSLCPLHIALVLYSSHIKNFNDRVGNPEMSLLWAVCFVLEYLHTPRTCIGCMSSVQTKVSAVLVMTEQP